MKKKFKPGDIVVSRYRARWTGTIQNYCDKPEHCVVVKVTHDSCGKPQRKQFIKIIDESWLDLK